MAVVLLNVFKGFGRIGEQSAGAQRRILRETTKMLALYLEAAARRG